LLRPSEPSRAEPSRAEPSLPAMASSSSSPRKQQQPESSPCSHPLPQEAAADIGQDRYERVESKELQQADGAEVDRDGLPDGISVVRDRAEGSLWVRKSVCTAGLDRRTSRMLLAEGDVLSELDHVGVVKLREVIQGEAEGEAAFILERLQGSDCAALLRRRGRLLEPTVAALTRQLLVALEHCHGRGIVHRDVHPGNVVLVSALSRGRPRCKLVDFGYAAHLPQEGGEGLQEVAGNAPYMAPEMLTRKPAYAAKVDVWSAGIFAFELLTGSPPFGREADFGGASPADRLHRRVKAYAAAERHEAELEALPAWKQLSGQARSFFLQALQPDPELRPAAGEAARHPWLMLADAATPLRCRR